MDGASAIVACGSAPGRGIRAIVRVSGEPCAALVGAISDVTLERGVHMARVRLKEGPLPCVAFVALGPRSYTGEDSVEFVCAGNPDVVAALEAALFEAGRSLGVPCRAAAPGEFTLRAFVRGRIDLTQAEGIAATISATNDAQLFAARQLADGALGGFVRDLADGLANDLALVEAGIDFTDQEDVVAIPPARLSEHLQRAIALLGDRLDRAVPWERLEAIPRVVLAGAPNAGKSTLFNALLGRPRAVESSTAGTTRDALEEIVAWTTASGAQQITLVDIAGLDDDHAGLNPQMQAGAHDAMARAALILRCVPADAIAAAGVADELLVRTKCDLNQACDGLQVSARTGAGLDALRVAIVRQLGQRTAAHEGETLVLAARHSAALGSALMSLRDACDTVVRSGLREPELVAASLRSAIDELGSVSGAIAPDDVLGRIFGSFCVGK